MGASPKKKETFVDEYGNVVTRVIQVTSEGTKEKVPVESEAAVGSAVVTLKRQISPVKHGNFRITSIRSASTGEHKPVCVLEQADDDDVFEKKKFISKASTKTKVHINVRGSSENLEIESSAEVIPSDESEKELSTEKSFEELFVQEDPKVQKYQIQEIKRQRMLEKLSGNTSKEFVDEEAIPEPENIRTVEATFDLNFDETDTIGELSKEREIGIPLTEISDTRDEKAFNAVQSNKKYRVKQIKTQRIVKRNGKKEVREGKSIVRENRIQDPELASIVEASIESVKEDESDHEIYREVYRKYKPEMSSRKVDRHFAYAENEKGFSEYNVELTNQNQAEDL